MSICVITRGSANRIIGTRKLNTATLSDKSNPSWNLQITINSNFSPMIFYSIVNIKPKINYWIQNTFNLTRSLTSLNCTCGFEEICVYGWRVCEGGGRGEVGELVDGRRSAGGAASGRRVRPAHVTIKN